jgi:fucose permease
MDKTSSQPSKSMAAMHAFYPIIVISGFIQLLLPSTIRILMTNFSLNAGKAGILPLIFFTGISTSAFAITHIINKIGIKTIMVLAAFIVSVSLIAASQSQVFLLFASLIFFIGFGNGIIVTLSGIYATISFGIGQIFQHSSAEVGISSIALLFVIATGMLLAIRKEIPIIKHIRNNPLL